MLFEKYHIQLYKCKVLYIIDTEEWQDRLKIRFLVINKELSISKKKISLYGIGKIRPTFIFLNCDKVYDRFYNF